MSALFQKIFFDNKEFVIMRDDLSHPTFSGNKARKLAYIINEPKKYSHIKTIVSFGGNQSNFMFALSQLAKLMGWQFEYWIKPLPKFLKQKKIGNLDLALKNGMILFETTETLTLENIKKNYLLEQQNFSKPLSGVECVKKDTCLFFDQGGRDPNAETGLADCANEIKDYCCDNNIANYSVVVASGTGTTALYLEKYLPKKIYTVSCVGTDKYLTDQFNSIDNTLAHPQILQESFKSNFGQLDIKNYQLYNSLLKETGIEFELLYDPITWRVLLENYDNLPKPIVYIHCGGTSGNATMLARYNRLLNS
ncbi:1-aminocyclopropane-1-carboxylate deaminase [Francisella adeliensis]|uniref:1-aminocyclopropane-1-carboxylate deaminase n=1 Tax=Francisella adeliensis TaxID=2007306 RepID=A0A2Z4XYG1_9GAMM|nr:1-aminocyclopropane-1-carboxylate deaminase [Francisella adeliensis]AXA33706.1 1-aminocyclopropane-1-carboxylate deaminase [Francisella adeliensis]MBK2085601.1 1-aminocyclopropane-1-carboxylate deaminase [Francisella adeliensis]MBK2097479.1 1-aminocyclopropane-1-carboxylate deaminase [Francisella adeliensis]QIW11940.1 1-aminocyclopropane-1-carboxylate deaminase [Francisella adeliensis]QIW13816.1 1-aminocyclopropane-1-carboxylate deaminase [Francisella adeliensis]